MAAGAGGWRAVVRVGVQGYIYILWLGRVCVWAWGFGGHPDAVGEGGVGTAALVRNLLPGRGGGALGRGGGGGGGGDEKHAWEE